MASKRSEKDDIKQLVGYVHGGELKELKSFLSAKNIAPSDSLLWSEDKPLIMRAVRAENVEITQYLLAHYPKSLSINHKYAEFVSGDTARTCSLLYVACRAYDSKKRLRLVQSLLKAGASPNVGDSIGNMPLHTLLGDQPLNGSNSKVIRCLVEHGADVNLFTGRADTPLHSLARNFLGNFGKNSAILCYLVQHGADVNVGDSTGNTPLHDHVLRHPEDSDYLRCLVAYGADVNATNELGVTPLMVVATQHNSLVSLRYLLKKGANPNTVDARGFSAVHHAALSGQSPQCRLRVLQELLLFGAPMFKSAPSSDEERQQYVPCPLYLAAADILGRKEIVQELLKHPQCPPVCKAEASLLLASADCDENGMSSQTQDLWRKALSIYEENDIHPTYLPPIEAYGNRVEIQSIDQLRELSSSSTSLHEAYYQSLIIRERCIGTRCGNGGCFGLIKALQKRSKAFIEQGKYAEAEQLFLYATDVFIHVFDHVKVYDETIMISMIQDTHLCEWLEKFVLENYVPNFEHFVKYAIRLHDALSRRDINEDGHIVLVLRVVLVFAISITACADVTVQKLGSSRVHYTLEELGHEFVSKLLQEPNTLNILHEASSLLLCDTYDFAAKTFRHFFNFGCLSKNRYASTMLSALVRWGADRIIDQPNSSGQRFLHLAVQSKYATSFVPILLEHNPHLDAVDANGKTAFDLCAFDELRSLFPSDPPPLTCQAAKVVVSEKIPYQEVDLPAHIKTLISLHDCKAVQ